MSEPHVTIAVDLPSNASREAPEALARRLRLLWVLDEVRCGRLTRVRAASELGLSIDALLSEAAAHGVDAIDYDLSDLRDELGTHA